MPADLAVLARTLRARRAEITGLPVVAGLDGFVDEMISVVRERSGLGAAWKPVPTIAEFAQLMAAAAGRSSLREIVVTSRDPGGCAVNFGDGIASLGVALDAFATLGTPRNPAFDAFAGKCHSCTSWGRQPGLTLALEFSDGKYMLSSVSQLEEITPDLVRTCLADGAFLAACRRAKLIALTNWTLYPHMTAVWRLLQQEVFSRLTHRPLFFIDLVDPRSRTAADIAAMLEVLRGFEACGPTVLGGNLNEANAVAGVLGLAQAAEEPAAVMAQAAAIRQKLGIAEVCTHCLKIAALAEAGGTASAPGPFCPKPRKSTGAGDRFNAGYCLGRLLGLPPETRLALGNATSGFFVRNARSAGLDELATFCEAWAAGHTDA